jgi:hypothetical protein
MNFDTAMGTGRWNGLQSSSTPIGAVMQGNQGVSLVCLTSYSLGAVEVPPSRC